MDNMTKKRESIIAHLNIRSVRNKIETLQIHMKQEQIDILTLSETWLDPRDADTNYLIDNYSLIRYDRAWGARPSNLPKKRRRTMLLY